MTPPLVKPAGSTNATEGPPSGGVSRWLKIIGCWQARWRACNNYIIVLSVQASAQGASLPSSPEPARASHQRHAVNLRTGGYERSTSPEKRRLFGFSCGVLLVIYWSNAKAHNRELRITVSKWTLLPDERNPCRTGLHMKLTSSNAIFIRLLAPIPAKINRDRFLA